MNTMFSNHGPVLSCLLSALCALTVLPFSAAAEENAGEGGLKVVELFTSQSCPNSPRADRNIGEVSSIDGVIAVSLPITYWDYFGWKDTLARKAHDDRQEHYISAMPDQWPFTPQAIINGKASLKGDDRDALVTALDDAEMLAPLGIVSTGPSMRITLPADQRGNDSVLTFVAWSKTPVTVDVESGKNAGKSLTYTNVVRVLDTMPVDDAGKGVIDYPMPDDAAGHACVFILQDAQSGRMTAAGRCPAGSS